MKMFGDIVILPASVNMAIIMPYNKNVPKIQYLETVRNMNRNEMMEEQEVLKDCVIFSKAFSNIFEVLSIEEGEVVAIDEYKGFYMEND